MTLKIKEKVTALLTAAFITANAAAIPANAAGNNSGISQGTAFSQTYFTNWKNLEQQKFPAGKYWNHDHNNQFEAIDEYCTNNPCLHDNGYAGPDCNSISLGYQVDAGYPYSYYLEGVYHCFSDGQCCGFARKLASDLYKGCNVWLKLNYQDGHQLGDIDQIRVGDQLRIGNNSHSVFITEVNGGTVKFADCNWDHQCGIRWDVTATVATINWGGKCRRYLYFMDENGYYTPQIDWIERPVMAGDVDGDSVITPNDFSIMSQIFLNNYDFSGKDRNAITRIADLDNDGSVSFADLYIAYYQYDGSGYYRNLGFLNSLQ